MWHFSETNKMLRFGDNREIVPDRTLKVEGPLEMCKRGLHASARLIDAVVYAPGPYVWFVELSGEVQHGGDKSVATERTAIWGYDATEVLKAFSLRIALNSVEKYWDETKFGVFPEVVKQWLRTGDESLRSAAWSAAESAAWSAAESAAWSAAESAAWSAARSAAESAAWSAARSAAAESAARSAAESAAWSAHNDWLTEMIIAGRPDNGQKGEGR